MILAQLVIEDPEQKILRLDCNLKLSKIANDKAKEMTHLGRVSHIGRNPANKRLIDAGYRLSKIYPRFLENNVEAIAGGITNPNLVWKKFKNSNDHRMHLLAEHEFYRLQNEIGVGFYADKKSPHVEYWVIYIAHQNPSNDYNGRIAKSKE